jgi:DtxR family Mn-dependent transcriptional regulator
MTRNPEHSLSESQEDYLEVILSIVAEEDAATISDIAERKGVSMPSATAAVGRLSKLGLVEHDSYGKVGLTRAGRRAAKSIASRHVLLERFLTDVLLVDPAVAEEDACTIEHHLSSETIKSIMAFFDFLEGLPDGGREWLATLHRSISKEGDVEVFLGDTLNRVEPGGCARVVRVAGTSDLRRRLIEMGITKGVRVRVQRVAPLGDPMAVEVGGSSISLRKSEASQIVVERCPAGRGRGRGMGRGRRGGRGR